MVQANTGSYMSTPTEYNQDYFEDGHYRAKAFWKGGLKQHAAKWRTSKSAAKANRKGYPGFVVEAGTLDNGEYLWFKCSRGDDASPCGSLTKHFTYFRGEGERWCIEVPVIAIRLAYREACALVKRVHKDGPRTVHGRHTSGSNARVAYHTDQYGHVWVGATLNTLVELAGDTPVNHLNKDALPNMNWSSLVMSARNPYLV